MADPKPGQFGSKENDPSAAGHKGSMAQDPAGKAKGGKNSHRGSQSNSSSS